MSSITSSPGRASTFRAWWLPPTTSLATTIASLAVGLAGYVATAPQPTDAPTPELKVIGLVLYFGMPIASWLIGLAAMKRYSLTRERMVEVQRENAERQGQREA